MSTQNQQIFSTVPFSTPSHFPGEEDFRMNGFAMSDELGIILALRGDGDPSLDPISQFRAGFATHNPDMWRKDPDGGSNSFNNPNFSTTD